MAKQQQKKSRAWLLLIALLVGIAVLLYPTVSSMVNAKNQSRVIAGYTDNISKLPDEEVTQARDAAVTFNRQLWQENGTHFAPYGSDLKALYQQELNLNGMDTMGYLNIPKVGVSLPIQHGTSEETLQNACGHLEGSSLPIGGENTHVVLSGHRGLPASKLFTDLDQLEIGDQFYLHVLGEDLAYQIDQIKTVLPEELDDLSITSGEDYVTLLTCTPYGINTHRLLVRGTRVPYVAEEEASTKAVSGFGGIAALTWYLIAGALILAILIILCIPTYFKLRAKRKGEQHSEKENR